MTNKRRRQQAEIDDLLGTAQEVIDDPTMYQSGGVVEGRRPGQLQERLGSDQTSTQGASPGRFTRDDGTGPVKISPEESRRRQRAYIARILGGF